MNLYVGGENKLNFERLLFNEYFHYLILNVKLRFFQIDC